MRRVDRLWRDSGDLGARAADVPRLDEVHLGARTVGFTLIVSTIAGLVIGLSPAWQFGNADPGDAMASGMRSTASRGPAASVLYWSARKWR
jgi:hypothetical protein